jgi:hypothetical protein
MTDTELKLIASAAIILAGTHSNADVGFGES